MSGSKFQACIVGIKVVGFMYDDKSWYSETEKILKILNASTSDLTAAPALIGICVCYHV